jgi:RluA family pseudouridine synthase
MKNPFKAIEALYADDWLMAVSKPAGVTSAHDGHRPSEPDLRAFLEPGWGALWTVHRLDRDTSGVILFARSEEAHRQLSRQFEGHETRKTYHAIVVGSPNWETRDVDAPLLVDGDRRHRTLVDAHKGKPALTRFKVLQRLKRFALVEAQPETGRTHQIRAHAALLGAPIVADALYGDGKPIYLSEFKRGYRANAAEEIPLMGRLALHALRLQFTHPESGEPLDIEAPYSKDFHATVNQLAKL